jgi:hypothetical protein
MVLGFRSRRVGGLATTAPVSIADELPITEVHLLLRSSALIGSQSLGAQYRHDLALTKWNPISERTLDLVNTMSLFPLQVRIERMLKRWLPA